MPEGIYAQLDDITRYLDGLRLRVDAAGNFRFFGVIESLGLFAFALLLVGAAKVSARLVMKKWSPNSQRPPR